jgi:hypothetical protein
MGEREDITKWVQRLGGGGGPGWRPLQLFNK